MKDIDLSKNRFCKFCGTEMHYVVRRSDYYKFDGETGEAIYDIIEKCGKLDNWFHREHTSQLIKYDMTLTEINKLAGNKPLIVEKF